MGTDVQRPDRWRRSPSTKGVVIRPLLNKAASDFVVRDQLALGQGPNGTPEKSDPSDFFGFGSVEQWRTFLSPLCGSLSLNSVPPTTRGAVVNAPKGSFTSSGPPWWALLAPEAQRRSRHAPSRSRALSVLREPRLARMFMKRCGDLSSDTTDEMFSPTN